MLPIVQRELQVAARSRKFYAWRVRSGILIVLVSLGMVMATGGGLRPGGASGAFQMLCVAALLFCLAEGLRKTSDAISEEKREGTLGLLFLSDLRGFDIVAGKWTAATIRSLNLLLAFFPVLAVTLLLGGTTAGEFWRSTLWLAAVLAASLSLCLLVSTLSREKSLGAAGGVLFVIWGAPLVAGLFAGPPANEWISALSPGAIFGAGADAVYGREPGIYWVGIGWFFAISAGSLTLASFILPRVWQEKPRKPMRVIERRRRLSRGALKRRAAMLDRNPAMWLMFNPRRARWLQIFAFAVAIAAVAVMAFIDRALPIWNIPVPDGLVLVVPAIAGMAIVLTAHVYVAREASRNLAEARENRLLELVLSTPLGSDTIIQGQVQALARAVATPALVLGFLAFLSAYVFVYAAMFPGEFPAYLLLLKGGAETVLGIVAAAWFGMWMALTSKGPGRAFLKTVGIGIILPHIICTPTIVNQIVLLVVAADKVKVHFRRYAAERYLQSESFALSPVPPGAGVPPVLRQNR